MMEFNTWDKINKISYIICLIILKQIGLHNLYEGYGVHIQRTSNTEYRAVTLEDESLVLHFRDADIYSSSINIFDIALKELKSRIQKKKPDTNIYHHLPMMKQIRYSPSFLG